VATSAWTNPDTIGRAELATLASFAWSSGRNGRDPDRRLDVYGPTGIRGYEMGMKRAFRSTIADQEGPLAQRPTFDDFAFWHELGEPDEAATVFRNQHVDVRVIRVQHGDLPAVGYRITTRRWPRIRHTVMAACRSA
jgi:hypothetical protein